MKALEYVSAVVDRGNTKIPVEVPEYELAVLKKIHNQDTPDGMIEMVIIGESRLQPLEEEFNPVEAFNALRRKYGNGRADPVLAVYASARDLASRVKLHDVDGRTIKRKTAESPQVSA